MIAKVRPPVWIVLGPLDPAALPDGCKAKEVPKDLLDKLGQIFRLVKKMESRERRRA